MKTNSPLYDRIRLKPDQERRLKESCPACDSAGCKEPATHRAPKGRGREGEYWSYCLPHVREYNQSYNYFKDMKDDAVQEYLRDSLTGHRPTWKMGQNGGQKTAAFGGNPKFAGQTFAGQTWVDPFQVFEGSPGTYRPDREVPEGRMIRNAERKALDTMGLDTDATGAVIKARFKELVKRHHPDANGGDRSTEDRLRSVIQAYNYLKSAGFC